MGRLFGYFVLVIFLIAIIFSVITASGNEELLDRLESEGATEEIIEQETEEIQPQVMQLDPDLPLSYTIESPKVERVFLLEDPNENEIKALLSKDIAVIAKVDTRKLKNPYYEVDAVIFLTITGYTSTHFETFDTGRAENKYFAYLITDFMRALGETGGDVMYVL